MKLQKIGNIDCVRDTLKDARAVLRARLNGEKDVSIRQFIRLKLKYLTEDQTCLPQGISNPDVPIARPQCRRSRGSRQKCTA